MLLRATYLAGENVHSTYVKVKECYESGSYFSRQKVLYFNQTLIETWYEQRAVVVG